MEQSTVPLETELKLRIKMADVGMLRRLVTHSGVCLAQGTRTLDSIYFDTPQGTLGRNGCAMRLRNDGQGWIQTVKAEQGSSAGLHRRGEWETARPSCTLDFSALAGTPLEPLNAGGALEASVQTVFATSFTRQIWLLDYDGAQVEVALDQGRIVAGGAEEPICELELELKSGPPVALFDLALEWGARICLVPFSATKAARGMWLARGMAPPPTEARAVPLTPGALGGAGRAGILFAYLDQLEANCGALVLAGRSGGGGIGAAAQGLPDPEFAHQARVALRRLRSSLKFFRQLDSALDSARGGRRKARAAGGTAAGAVPKDLSDGLRWLFRLLGAARDWDVFCGGALPEFAAGVEQPGVAEGLLEAAARHRAQAYATLRAALASQAYGLLLLRVGKVLLEGSGVAVPPSDFSFEGFTRRLLRRQQRCMQADLRRMEGTSWEQWHQLRIDGKAARYTGQLLEPLLAAKALRRHCKVLARMQDVLGRMNDQAQARGLTLRLLGEVGAGPGLHLRAHARFAARLVLLQSLAWESSCRMARGKPWQGLA